MQHNIIVFQISPLVVEKSASVLSPRQRGLLWEVTVSVASTTSTLWQRRRHKLWTTLKVAVWHDTLCCKRTLILLCIVIWSIWLSRHDWPWPRL